MSLFLKHKISIILGASCLLLGSCREEAALSPEESGPEQKVPRITLTISPISMSSVSEDVVEKIATLRIIMVSEQLDETGNPESYVELNRLIDFINGPEFAGGTGEVASTFRYVFTRPTLPGTKKFYLIANEGYVSDVSFQNEDAFDEGVDQGLNLKQGMNLTDFLDLFPANQIPGFETLPGLDNGEGEPNGEVFESLINTLYYTSDFITAEEGASIYLPYTSFYTFEVADPADEEATAPTNVISETMYLVPAATKFTFQFKNYRSVQLEIQSFKVSGLASDMYLFAQVNNSDQYKILNSKKLWWTNWLAGVAALSQQNQDFNNNEIFNQTHGWISDFEIPDSAFPDEYNEEINGEQRQGVVEFVPETYWYVDSRDTSVGVNIAEPGRFDTEYYYFPESRNLVEQQLYDENQEPNGTALVQRYYITMTMRDNLPGSTTVTKDTPIGNLGSMFRDTNTLITVSLRDALDVGAYAELWPWEASHSYGYVIEEENP